MWGLDSMRTDSDFYMNREELKGGIPVGENTGNSFLDTFLSVSVCFCLFHIQSSLCIIIEIHTEYLLLERDNNKLIGNPMEMV